MFRTFLVGLLIGVVVCTVGFALLLRADRQGREASDQLELRLAHGLNERHPVHQAMVFMADRVAEKSNGRMRIRIFPNEQLGSEGKTVELVQSGGLAMSKTSTGPLEAFIPDMSVFSQPYIFRNHDHFWRVLRGPIGRELLEAGAEQDLIGLCYYDAGARSFYTVDQPVLEPADLAGMKIRVQESPTAMAMIRAMGGSPTPIAWGELYTALETGTVEGAENNPPSFRTSGHYEVAKHYSLNEHARVPDILLINRTLWEQFSPEQRGWLAEAARESSDHQRELWAERTAADLAFLQEAGVKIYHPDPGPFAEAIQPMLEEHEGTRLGNLIQRIRAVETPPEEQTTAEAADP